jgi:hypothetical protein
MNYKQGHKTFRALTAKKSHLSIGFPVIPITLRRCAEAGRHTQGWRRLDSDGTFRNDISCQDGLNRAKGAEVFYLGFTLGSQSDVQEHVMPSTTYRLQVPRG